MAKAHQDQVNWPYAPPNYYPQPRGFNIPYAQGRVCQESCCRRGRGPLPYPPPLPPPSLPCRSSQDNSYLRAQPSQVRGFIPVNPYVQQHGGLPQHPQSAVHRPIPQTRYDYNDFYRYGSNTTNNNNHQGFHPTVLKQNANSYNAPNPPHVTEQYPACSHYTPTEQESSVPSLDVRQFLATWQDKDEEVFESDQQNKPKSQYPEPPSNSDVFKPLDCTKRNEPPLSMYGYTHNQMNNHPAYYNKTLQAMPNHQSVNENSYKNSPYLTGNSYHPVAVENDCNFTTSQVNMSPHSIVDSDPQHVSYERRIEKIFNPHGCKGMPNVPSNEQNHCAVDKGNHNLDIKTTVSEKTQYHLSASLECEDLFDDINRKREERQRNIVHPLCYQESYSQRLSGNLRVKPDIPHVSVKPNTAAPINYPNDNYAGHMLNMDSEMELKKPKSLPLKKWVQKRKKSEDEFFPAFNISEPTVDFSNRETVIERSHIPSPCDPNIGIPMVPAVTANDANSCSDNMSEANNSSIHVPTQNSLSNEMSVSSCTNIMINSEKNDGDCVFTPVTSIVEPTPQVDSLQVIIPCPTISPQKAAVDANQTVTISSDDIDISLASSCDMVVDEQHSKEGSETISNYLVLDEEGKSEMSVDHNCNETVEDKLDSDQTEGNNKIDSVLKPEEGIQEVLIQVESKEVQEEPASSLSNGLTTIAYMYDDETIVSENSLDSSQIEPKAKLASLSSKHKSSSNKSAILKNNRVLSLWRHRNRLFPKSVSLKKTSLVDNKYKCKEVSKTGCVREFPRFCVLGRRKLWRHRKTVRKGDGSAKNRESEVVNVVLTSLVDGVCQIGEVSSQVDDRADGTVDPQELITIDGEKHSTSNGYDGKSNVVCWELGPSDEKVTSTVESDMTEEEDSNLVISEEYIGYAEGSVVEGSDDRVLHGILNWPHHEEEITSINEKESIKVSLPWVKIFKPHSNLPDGEKTLEIGPARIELRYSPAPIEYQPGHYKSSRSSLEKKSSIFSVKKVLLKHNAGPPTERLPKMVIKKTGCEEYKSYIKDAKLRVISIKNSTKDGQAEVIIEADGPLIGAASDDESQITQNESTQKGIPRGHDHSDAITGPEVSEASSETNNELHHCLLCQESYTSLEKLHNHENSLSHRHIDIIQRNVLHKLQKTFKGGDFPTFQPLSATEIEYLNWKPNFSGYNHFYHNVPL